MSIVKSWLETYERPTDALNAINSDLDSKYTTSNLTQWKKESKGLTSRAYNYMLEIVLSSQNNNISFESLRCPDPKNPL